MEGFHQSSGYTVDGKTVSMYDVYDIPSLVGILDFYGIPHHEDDGIVVDVGGDVDSIAFYVVDNFVRLSVDGGGFLDATCRMVDSIVYYRGVLNVRVSGGSVFAFPVKTLRPVV